jgi:hypothetical protein
MRGVFLYRSGFGYTVHVDGVTLDLDVSWSKANNLARHIAVLRKPGDGRGYARCRHDGNELCWKAGEHLEVPNVET